MTGKQAKMYPSKRIEFSVGFKYQSLFEHMLLFEETISHGKTTPKLIRKKIQHA